jgi:hypothetical protein
LFLLFGDCALASSRHCSLWRRLTVAIVIFSRGSTSITIDTSDSKRVLLVTTMVVI